MRDGRTIENTGRQVELEMSRKQREGETGGEETKRTKRSAGKRRKERQTELVIDCWSLVAGHWPLVA